MIIYIQSSSIVRTVYSSISKDIQGYWCLFRHTHRHAVRGRGKISPAIFENWKKCPDFSKKVPKNVELWVIIPIQNLVIRVSTRRNSKMFPYGSLFLVFLAKSLLKCLSSTKDIQNLVQHLYMQKPGIFGILEYSERFRYCMPMHIQDPVILKKFYEYSELRHT